MGSYLAHGPEIYPKAHENPRAFSCIFCPIFLESSIQCPWGVGLHHHRWVKNTFNKKVRPCKFNEGDLVLKKVSHALRDHRGKWAPNYEGPFVVKKAFSSGALVLASIVVSILACHVGDPGSILSNGTINTLLDFPCSCFLFHLFFVQIYSREIWFFRKRTISSSI